MTNFPTICYAQGLTGRRWHLYAPWSKLLPHAFLDKFSVRWPGRCLWRGEITCGVRAVELQVHGGPMVTLGWLEKLRMDKDSLVITSVNLAVENNNMSLPAGRLLMAICLRQVLTELSAKMQLANDRLTVGLIAKGNEMACWLANIDGLARQVTIWSDRRSRLLPVAPSGLAPRQLDLSVTTIGVDVLIVAPEFLPWLSDKTLTPGTIVVRTDGAAAPLGPGATSISLNYNSLPLPAELLAERDDIVPLWEAIILAAYHSDKKTIWPLHWHKRLALMQQAVNMSEWQLTWDLVGVTASSAG